jgi:hypothetical protein
MPERYGKWDTIYGRYRRWAGMTSQPSFTTPYVTVTTTLMSFSIVAVS